MPDYITREEFDAAIDALRCVGDQQTIQVTQSPGGQTISSTQVIDVADTVAATSYIDVSYDSDDDFYTVVFTDMPFIASPVPGSPDPFGFGTVSRTFKFEGISLLSVKFSVWRQQSGGAGEYEIRWHGAESSVYDTDATTTAARLDTSNEFGIFQKITFDGVGAHTIDYYESYPVQSWGNQEIAKSRIYFDSGTLKFTLEYARPQETMSSWRNTGFTSLISPAVTLPFNDDLIIGYLSAGPTVHLDARINKATYDNWYEVGSAKVDASGDVRLLVLYKEDLITF